MVLSHELLQYAENLYRRFPEEFIALGMPGLEQTFDLRVDGSRSRKMLESPTEKTVEITIRRWQAPCMPPIHPSYSSAQPLGPPAYGAPAAYSGASGWQHHAAAAPRAHQDGYPQGPGGYNPQPQQQPAHNTAPAPNHIEAQMTSQLARLEAALSTMMPQVEAAVGNRAMTQYHHQEMHNAGRPGEAERSPGGSHHLSPVSPLRDRRHMASIKITPPNRVGEAPDPGVQLCNGGGGSSTLVQHLEQAAEVATAASTSVDTTTQRDSSPNNGRKQQREKPRAINAVRMVPNAMDPESPRSPGRYSAWK